MNIPFQTIDWTSIEKVEHKGERGTSFWQTLQFGGLRVRIVTYSENYLADHWCQKGHIVHCLEGEFESELENGETVKLTKGMTYIVSDELSSHRSVSTMSVKLLIIDGDFLKLNNENANSIQIDETDKILSGQVCPYCNCETTLVSDKAIYGPNSTYGGMYYRCVTNPEHYVGTYSDNKTSLGRLADKELRRWKMNGHKNFDILWREKPALFINQAEAYKWLSKQMNIDPKYTHFGMFTVEQCKQAVDFCINLSKINNNSI